MLVYIYICVLILSKRLLKIVETLLVYIYIYVNSFQDRPEVVCIACHYSVHLTAALLHAEKSSHGSGAGISPFEVIFELQREAPRSAPRSLGTRECFEP